MRTLITGSSGGIGAAIARKIAAPGEKLYLHYFRGETKVREVQRYCEAHGANTVLLSANLQEPAEIDTLCSEVDDPLDRIVFAHGREQYGLFTDIDNETLIEILYIHLTAPMQIVKHFLPRMITQKYGRIIAISSIWGEVGASCEVAYSAAKGGLNQFVQALAKEVAPSNITVNGVSPGVIDTKMMDTYHQDDVRALAEAIPAGRFGRADEVANACMYLLSEEAGYVNGHVLSINGAWGG